MTNRLLAQLFAPHQIRRVVKCKDPRFIKASVRIDTSGLVTICEEVVISHEVLIYTHEHYLAEQKATHLEQDWELAIESPPVVMPMRMAADGDGRLTVRVVRAPDASTAPRAAATIGLAAIAAWGWLASRRHGLTWELLRAVAAWSIPVLLIVGGGFWAAVLVPALPGWLMLGAGSTVLAVWYTSRHAAVADDEWTDYPSTHSLRDV